MSSLPIKVLKVAQVEILEASKTIQRWIQQPTRHRTRPPLETLTDAELWEQQQGCSWSNWSLCFCAPSSVLAPSSEARSP